MTLRTQAWLSLVVLMVVFGLLLFVPAGTMHYWQAWVFLAVYSSASAVIIIGGLKRSPALLERRMRGGPTAEKTTTQRVAMTFASIGFIGLLLIPAFDRRFDWSHVPGPLVAIGDLLVALSFVAMAAVLLVNPFAASTIDVVEGQTVISTGPYAKVRHPMYAGASLLLMGTPLALGSWCGFAALAVLGPAVVWRMLDEERFLARNLPGYVDYMRRVRYRLMPKVF